MRRRKGAVAPVPRNAAGEVRQADLREQAIDERLQWIVVRDEVVEQAREVEHVSAGYCDMVADMAQRFRVRALPQEIEIGAHGLFEGGTDDQVNVGSKRAVLLVGPRYAVLREAEAPAIPN